MTFGPQTVQEQRWQAWHERTCEIGKSDSGQRYCLWPSFLEKAENARLDNIATAAFIGLMSAGIIMIITMVATMIPDSIDHHCSLDANCLGFKIGSGVAALSFVLPTCAVYRCVMKHRREIQEDKDDHGEGLYQRTIEAGTGSHIGLKDRKPA